MRDEKKKEEGKKKRTCIMVGNRLQAPTLRKQPPPHVIQQVSMVSSYALAALENFLLFFSSSPKSQEPKTVRWKKFPSIMRRAQETPKLVLEALVAYIFYLAIS